MSTEIVSIITAALSGSIGSLLTVIFSRKKNIGIKNELKATKAEIEKLKARLNEFTINPLTLNDEGFYYDADGKPYCGGCYGSPYERIPLKPLNQQGSWTLYQCPACNAFYQKGTPPKPKRHNTLDDF
jgi:hypothetical protein